MIRTMIAAAALAASAAAQADVVYEWETTEPGNVPAFGAQLRVDDAAWSPGGSLDYTWRAGSSRPDRIDAGAPVTLFEVAGQTDGRFFGLALAPRTGGSFVENNGIPSDPLRVRLQFLDDGGLAGLIRGTNSGLDIGLTGEGGVWRLFHLTNEFPNLNICRDSEPNSGNPNPVGCTAVGRWVLDAATIPDGVGQVPEPGILPLMALASVGLGLSLRRRRAQ